MTLLRVARQAEVGEGQKVIKEAHGRKLLLVRVHGTVYCTDAHCFHMGTSLAGGDIEDSGSHACIVCPAHRYRIELCSGKKIDRKLDGAVCASADQKQRIYEVHPDPEFIWVTLPDSPPSPLPSDAYNQVAYTPSRPSYGLFGSAAGMARPPLAPPTPLQPFAGSAARPLVHSPTDGEMLQLSQESTQGSSVPSPEPVRQRLFAGRVDAPHVARRKAAVAAIRAKAYKPPMAATPHTAPTQNQTSKSGGQQTLFDAWRVTPVPAVEDMEF
ncbi:hypothetical protein ACKKBF_B37820 [Auxenochlorella protothecoides x Auxenochlorella symbiontica]